MLYLTAAAIGLHRSGCVAAHSLCALHANCLSCERQECDQITIEHVRLTMSGKKLLKDMKRLGGPSDLVTDTVVDPGLFVSYWVVRKPNTHTRHRNQSATSPAP